MSKQLLYVGNQAN